MTWIIPKMWEGGECWIIGGGPSLTVEFEIPQEIVSKVRSQELPLSAFSPFLSSIHDKHVIGVNAAFLLGNWIDIAFFGDSGFYFKNIRAMNQFPNLKVGCNKNLLSKPNVKQVKVVHRDGKHPSGITKRPNYVSWNLNSGAAAINFAYHLGVKTIYLLGFDNKLNEEEHQHWHAHYKNAHRKKAPHKLPFHRFQRGYPVIAKDAHRLGLTIINVSRDSAILSFKKARLFEVL